MTNIDKKDFYKLFDLRDYPSSFESEEDREQIKTEVRERIYASIKNSNKQQTIGSKQDRYIFFKIAASLAIMISLTFVIYRIKSHQAQEYLTFTNPKGKIVQLTLSDGSQIWLNAGTSIHYPKKFRATRDVYLDEGEAFFDVTHDPQKPFIVHSANVRTQVIGTAFSVKTYKTAPSINISVVRGKSRHC